jgi:Tfp pilus assembly protein FimT
VNRVPLRFADDGFSLLELIIIVAIAGVMMVAATLVMPGLVSQSRADSAAAVVLNTLRLARDRAIGERRNMEIVFVPPKQIQVVRQEVGGGSNLTVMDVSLEGEQKFLRFSPMGDTPDLFGLTNSPVAFGTTQGSLPTIMFTSEGSLVDGSGDTINGTLFFAMAGDATSARAVTIFGATGLLRSWRWDGKQWAD